MGLTQRADAVSLADVVDALYPVGSIYISTLSTNPNTLLGRGTWAAFGEGKVLVGRNAADTDFDTAEETGGAKTHTHTLSNSGWAKLGYAAAAVFARIANVTVTAWNASIGLQATGGNSTASSDTGITRGIGLGGATDAGSTLPPYIVVYMWKRTA